MSEQMPLFLKACFRQPTQRTPVWMMRQAGRYLPEYRAIRARYDFVTMVRTPELVARITCLPVEHLQVDAAILFSDILVVPEAMGLELEFVEGKGPVFAEPLSQPEDLQKLQPVDPGKHLDYVLEGIQRTREQLPGQIPLIGFSGAPWTLATYMIEGHHSRDFRKIKTWRYRYPEALHQLLQTVARVVGDYLRAQVQAGAQAIQLFDTWAGVLDARGFETFVLPYVNQIARALTDLHVPLIYFSRGTGAWLSQLKTCPVEVVGLDWTVDLTVARKVLGSRFALQGNLDPVVLHTSPVLIRQYVREMLLQYGPGPGYIANLGHGILPDTPVAHARAFIQAVKEESTRMHAEPIQMLAQPGNSTTLSAGDHHEA